MTIGLAVFIASDALGALVAAISCRRAAIRLGAKAAAKYGALLALSLAIYTGACLGFGYGFGPQSLAIVAGCLPLWLGHRYVPSLDELRGDQL
jgi:fatty acid desaturase